MGDRTTGGAIGRTTRRDYLTTGLALVGGGILTGCLGDGGSSTATGTASPRETTTNTPTATAATETTSASGKTTTTASTSTTTASTSTTPAGANATGATAETASQYSVAMSPVGEVEFTGVPQNVMVYSMLYADMAVAYGHGGAVNSLGFDAEAGGKTLEAYYSRLEGVSFDRSGLTQLNSGSGNLTVPKELFYELNSDLHLLDPCLVLSFDGWEQSDIEEVRTNVAPWFGNTLSRNHSQPPDGYTDEYQYYTLWEIAEKVASVFQEQRRFEEFAAVRTELLETVQSKLPSESERPTVGSILFMEETFFPSKINAPGFANAHVRPFGAPDGFAAEDVTYETSYDYETMLEIDPEILLHRYGIASYDVGEIQATLESHPVASQLTAVKNDRVYASGHPVQGPIMNLFQLEMTAKQLYPDQFGEWPTYEEGPYPEIPTDEQLFDRGRVADVITGEFRDG